VTHAEIVSSLSRLIESPTTDVLYSITMQQVIKQIVHRMGDDVLSLTPAELELARTEVIAVLEHSLDYRQYIDEGLDIWQISRHL
jgi:hypothetical protein